MQAMVTKPLKTQGYYVPGTSFWSVSLPGLSLDIFSFTKITVLWELSHNTLEERPCSVVLRL